MKTKEDLREDFCNENLHLKCDIENVPFLISYTFHLEQKLIESSNPKEPSKGAVEILKKNLIECTEDSELVLYSEKAVIKAMEEYAHLNKPKQVTEGMIEGIAEEMVRTHKDFEAEGLSEYMNGFLNGCNDGIRKGLSLSLKEPKGDSVQHERESEWISVDDKMNERPIMEHGKEVLCYGHGEFLVGYLYHKYGKAICEADDTMLEGVTHWQPLIDPSKFDNK